MCVRRWVRVIQSHILHPTPMPHHLAVFVFHVPHMQALTDSRPTYTHLGHLSCISHIYTPPIYSHYAFIRISFSQRYAACKHCYNLNIFFALSFFFPQSASRLHLPKRTLNAIKDEIRRAPQKVFKKKKKKRPLFLRCGVLE